MTPGVVAIVAWPTTLELRVSAIDKIASPVDTNVDKLCSLLVTELCDDEVEMHCACVLDKPRGLAIEVS